MNNKTNYSKANSLLTNTINLLNYCYVLVIIE